LAAAIDERDPMQHELRAEIMDLLGEVEASSLEIRRQLPEDPTLETVVYHLAVLEYAGLVERVGGLWRRVN
jgi:DNA-binding transcriptional ArsR family regulator